MTSIYKALSALALTFTLGLGSASAVTLTGDSTTFSSGSGSSVGTLSWDYQVGASSWDLLLSYVSTGNFTGTITANLFDTVTLASRLVSFDASSNFSQAYGGNFYLNSSIASVSPVPEPETYAMLMAGLIAIWLAARRHRRGQSVAMKQMPQMA